jgi:hypothetical protein
MNRQTSRAALRSATRATRAAGGDPAMAAELDALRRVRTGSYALMQVLVTRMGGGPVDIPRGEWQALPPKERLKVKVDPESSDVQMWIEKEPGEPSVEGL